MGQQDDIQIAQLKHVIGRSCAPVRSPHKPGKLFIMCTCVYCGKDCPTKNCCRMRIEEVTSCNTCSKACCRRQPLTGQHWIAWTKANLAEFCHGACWDGNSAQSPTFTNMARSQWTMQLPSVSMLLHASSLGLQMQTHVMAITVPAASMQPR